MGFKRNGIRTVSKEFCQEDIETLKQDWKEHLQQIPPLPKDKFSGRGIVYTAGGRRYITCAWVSISLLRRTGCTLPIELWYMGNEISTSLILKFSSLGVECRNFLDHVKTDLSGYVLKPLAILLSRFEEVLFIDADNNPVSDPTSLFNDEKYKATGTIFWPDFWKTDRKNPIWSIIESDAYHSIEQESGQIMINKSTCWKELNLCYYFNQLSEYYYHLLLGDKDTFKFSWIATGRPYNMIPYDVGTCGYVDCDKFYGTTMVQHDFQGNIIFLHRNLLKWDVTHDNERSWQLIRRFADEPGEREVFFIDGPDGALTLDIGGQVIEESFVGRLGDLEVVCLDFLLDLKKSKEYHDFIEFVHFASFRYRKDKIVPDMNTQL